MSAAHLIPLASLMIDMMLLGQFQPAHASEANVPPPVAEESVQKAEAAADLKIKPETAASVEQKTPVKSAEAPRAAAKTVPEQKKSIAASENPEKDNSAAEPPSIMKMLEGRERELLAAIAIAAAFFAIGWICGGNYYLRRDRRRRTKLRF